MGIDSISKQRVQQDPDYANMVNADLRTFVYLDGEYLVDKETAKNSVRMMDFHHLVRASLAIVHRASVRWTLAVRGGGPLPSLDLRIEGHF